MKNENKTKSNMKLNFVLIDDSEIDLFVNQKFIEKSVGDVEILTFIRAKNALDHFNALSGQSNADHSFIPDFIFVDINMPEMDGFEFLDAFAKLKSEHFPNTKVYIVSSSTLLKEIVAADNHFACDGFISKPLTSRSMQQLVDSVTSKIADK